MTRRQRLRQWFVFWFAPRRYCQICAIANWVNPTSDHRNWAGHDWTPGKSQPTYEQMRDRRDQ